MRLPKDLPPMDTFSLALALALAFGLDFALGDPPNRFHPVCLMGWWADRVEAGVRRVLGGTSAAGALAAAAVLLPITGAAWLAARGAEAFRPPWGGISAAAAALYICFAPRGLAVHAWRVLSPLERGHLPDARRSLAMMVGRDTSRMEPRGMVMACVESVAENLTDGVASPLFWTCAGACLGGAPAAAAAAVLHRASNTLDSMWGKRDARYMRFGTCAARLDDALNFLPARLAWLASSLAAALLPGLSGRDALRIGWRDAGKHESPNSAWTEAAFAGALGLRLGGPAVYAGRPVEHPWIGGGDKEPAPSHIRGAVRLMLLASLLFAAASCAMAASAARLLRAG